MAVNKEERILENDAPNRRQYSRIRAQLAMKYRLLREEGASPAWNSTLTKNISAAGICFESFHPLSLNTMLEIKLEIPFYDKPVFIKARVVRAAEIKPAEIYGVAAAIVDIKESDRIKLQTELEQIDINAILHKAVKAGASDVHLSLNQPPMMRKANELIAIQIEVLDKVVLKRMIFSLLNEDQINKLLQNLELNTAVTILMIEGVYRFRLNVLVQQSSFEAVFHFIPNPVPEIKDLNLPSSINSFADLESGLVICAGPARSGKTTTCAALLDRINKEYIKSILTLQEPVEYVFPISQSIIRQREVGVDTQSFKHGLEQSIFQDVDVIMVSRLDNAQTAELALYAALSGKLVFVTLTSLSSVDALQKIINFFPSERQYHVRMMLANCLRAVIFQKLLPMQKKPGTLIPATEILLSNKELRHIIIDGFFVKIMFILENDRAAVMHSLKQSITKLWEGGVIASSIINALNE